MDHKMDKECDASTIYDPLSFNFLRQNQLFLEKIRSSNIHSALITTQLSLATLSRLLTVSSLTTTVADVYRPILFDLCARWIEQSDCTEDQLVALCLLIEVHEELYPILHQLLLKPAFIQGLLTSQHLDKHRLHCLLLAYYRILQANRQLPDQLFWSLTHLSAIIWTPTFDSGSRLLAIRCYALQSGMCEAECEKLQHEILGDACGLDCPLEYGQNIDGSVVEVDGWIMPVLEVKRVRDARNHIAMHVNDYFLEERTIPLSELRCGLIFLRCEEALNYSLSPLVANVEGILLLRAAGTCSKFSPLISTQTTRRALRSLGHRLSLRLPVLLTSPPSSGKSTLLSHLASCLFPGCDNHVVNIHLADTSLDPRSLIGSYASSQTEPGTFEWKEGVLVRAMREGKWVVLKDIDRGSNEVLGVIKPLVESLSSDKWIGGCATLEVPGRGRFVAHHNFAIFATRSVVPSRTGNFPNPLFFGAHKYSEVVIPLPSTEDLVTMVDSKFPRLAGSAARAFICMWESVKALGTSASTRDIGLRELQKLCVRVDRLLPASHQPMLLPGNEHLLSAIFTGTTFREHIFLEARDVFFGAAALTMAARTHLDAIVNVIGEHLALESERRQWLLNGWEPDFHLEKDVNDVVVAVNTGNTRIAARTSKDILLSPSRPFAMHRPAVLLLSRLATAVSLGEPVLLTGETGTGKTSIITHFASLLRRPLISMNLSHQTESTDLLGGFKPIDARIPASALQERFLELFGATFSRRKNEKFETEVKKAVSEGKWKRVTSLWKESAKLARERIHGKMQESAIDELDSQTPRKRRKVDASSLSASEANWNAFESDVVNFQVHHVQGKSKFAFGFVEGPLVKALRNGDWVLLDEVNLASSETLECVSSLLQGPTSSITLTEQGSLEPVPRHPDFRLFACMNPATDVGKKDLPPNIRCRFTEIDVPPPDADRDTLITIVTQYIGHVAVGDKPAILNVAEFYSAVKQLSETRQIADGSNHRPHYSMRTLARALTFAADTASTFGLRRAIWEGCLMAFTMVLDGPSAELVTSLAQRHLLAGVRNPRSILSKNPPSPSSRSPDGFVNFGPFYLEKGPLEPDSADEYILTPSVETKLIDLARIILTRRFPILIEGPTSSGKTSSIEYLARRTGHSFIRINNHEHTDIQEYLGSYVPDPVTGKLVFQDGLLVRALRNGDWIVLDELNLAPTDVLEALNRLLDDNRELVIPETQEVVRPHPHFMLFATQNPPGLYAGRKVLSRAFRNRFLEVHFDDVPEAELETILCLRCRIAPSYGKKIVAVFHELQNRRQSGRVFESKLGFATLRDLFRWAGRDAISYQELAENGYMLLAERTRRSDDKAAVKDVIESVMGVRLDEDAIYNLQNPAIDFKEFLACPVPQSSGLIWTKAMQRLFILVGRALRFNEPVLLVGETGCGKTSVCQVIADAKFQPLHTLNCHQGTETADLIGGLRPVRNRAALEADTLQKALDFLQLQGCPLSASPTPEHISSQLDSILQSSPELRPRVDAIRQKLGRLNALFEWHDGPLIVSMIKGNIFLLDEISLADDSVLERLNSVLEPSRAIVLAEKGGDNLRHSVIKSSDSFQLVATMNPGGDYGKKELSPALRNRFTEIWVPSVDNRHDLELIVNHMWQHEELRIYTGAVLDFVEWLCFVVGDRSLMNLRDILSWVTFSNSVLCSQGVGSIPGNEIFHHAAYMSYIDGLGSLPQLSGYSRDALQKLKHDAVAKIHSLVPISDIESTGVVPWHEPSEFFQLGSFAIPRGPQPSILDRFNFQAPTTQDNSMRVVRACQLFKPILLEGSPGVGKTSLITALAKISGHELYRINLSDQTDLADLFGSDLPVEGGGPGEFVWKNADFLEALVKGHWVLLDEMNLAPQSVLEGLNSVFDHRGMVFIPELGRSFVRHRSFRIFAAQNPLNQGSGRKGLPKSFLNRFTKVYIEELRPDDLHLVCGHLFPDIDSDILRAMVIFNTKLNEEVSVRRSFGREGSPWEFNLRDVIRWGSLIRSSKKHPVEYLRPVYLHRFRTLHDRQLVCRIFDQTFQIDSARVTQNPTWSITASYMEVGHFGMQREKTTAISRPGRVLKMHLSALEAAGHCLTQSWLTIITGGRDVGKTALVRLLAHLTGNLLREVSMSSATDTMDILGSFEQVDSNAGASAVIQETVRLAEKYSRTWSGSRGLSSNYDTLRHGLQQSPLADREILLYAAQQVVTGLHQGNSQDAELLELQCRLERLTGNVSSAGQFEWLDGPLVQAMKKGHWLLLDGANLCNPSVLDRLNSVCEIDGYLSLNERGHVDGKVQIIKAHPNFKLFMCVDPQHGELSRAMRNRGIEIAIFPSRISDDCLLLQDHSRLPVSVSCNLIQFDLSRRGLSSETFTPPLNTSLVSTGYMLDQDSALSNLLDHCPAFLWDLSSPTLLDAFLYFLARSAGPAYNAYLRRFLVNLEQKGNILYAALRKFVDTFPGPAIHAISTLRSRYSMKKSVPSAHVFAQPLDSFGWEEQLSDTNTVSNSIVLRVLDLATMMVLDEYEPSDANIWNQLSKLPERQAKAIAEIEEVSKATRIVCHEILGAVGSKDREVVGLLDIALKVLVYATRMRSAASQSHFDYSALQAITGWMAAALQQCPSQFLLLQACALVLQNTVSLSSGLGLVDLWSSFLKYNDAPVASELVRLDDLVSHLEISDKSRDTRRKTLSLMALCMTGNLLSTDDDHMALNRLIQDAEQAAHTGIGSADLFDETILGAELGLISMQLSSTSLRRFLQVICQRSKYSLVRIVPYQHLLWAIDSNEETLPIITRKQIRWMNDIWAGSSSDIASGPSIFLGPADLISVISLLESSFAMASLSEYEDKISRSIELHLLRCEHNTSRFIQIIFLLRYTLSLVSSAFGCGPIPFETSSLDETSPFAEVLSHFESQKHNVLTDAVRTYVQPAFAHFNLKSNSRRRAIADLGYCWIAVAKMILHLVIPDVPVDPAAIQSCALSFSRDQDILLSSQIDLHVRLEQMVTGNAENPTTSYLRARRHPFLEYIKQTPTFPCRANLSRIHMFWSEVSQFVNQVVSSSKIDGLLHLLETEDSAGGLREETIQQSIRGFLQRLESVYSDFADITSLLRYSLLHLRMGLRIIKHAYLDCGASDAVERLVTALVSFPSVQTASLLLQSKAFFVTTDARPFQHLLLQLSALAYDASTCAGKQVPTDLIEQVYDQMILLWLHDRTKEAEAEKAAQSLYRTHTSDFVAASESEIEEQEFLALFPSFEDVMENDRGKSSARSGASVLPFVTPSQIHEVFDLHQRLFTLDHHFPPTGLKAFIDIRLRSLKDLQCPLNALTDTIDDLSLAFNLSLLYGRYTECRKSNDPKSYNFYLQANMPEVRKAVEVVQRLRERLEYLIKEWPDQMVLHHLKERCNAVLSLDINSPVAKVLSALEHLLLQTEDWEIYANRDNNLKSERAAITGLIVEWRRLELSCWDTLLDSESTKFQSGISEWWFRLYDATIRGPLDALEREEAGVDSVSAYFDSLLPLLDDFIRGSPLGQFHARLKLLRSFEMYCQLIVTTKSPSGRATLARVRCILRATANYFEMYLPSLSSYLLDQRAALEKEVKGFVKLASWKDVNVQALKQSAQRTHHQLYKIIRKFREVLRLPVSDRLLPSSVSRSEGEHESSELWLPKRSVEALSIPIFPDHNDSTSMSHLLNLDRTYRKYIEVTRTKLLPYIASILPRHVDSLAVEIIVESQSLSTVVVPADATSEKRERHQKALLVRKRKAWSDLLKELKRAGFATNLRPDTLRQQQDARWIREQPILLSHDESANAAIQKSESYFIRLQGSLTDLRASIPNHHSDLTTRELQRGVMFLESGFSMAIQSRARLATAVEDYSKFKRILLRIRMLSTCSGIAYTGVKVLEQISNLKSVLCRLSGALQEIVEGLIILREVDCVNPIPGSSIQETKVLLDVVEKSVKDLMLVIDNVQLTNMPVLLADELPLIESARGCLSQVMAALASSSERYSHARYLFSSTASWLQSQSLLPLCSDVVESPTAPISDNVIDACLVVAQGFMAKCPDSSQSEDDGRDAYVRSDYAIIHDMTKVAKIGGMVDSVEIFLLQLATQPQAERLSAIHRCLPFLEQYSLLVQDQLASHCAWTKSLFKLDFVLCSLLRSLSKEGFCKPPDVDESGSGEGTTETIDGLGMGEGSGSQNVSKEIQEESQVEGLQGDNLDEKNDDNEGDDNDDAIEMADDFGGDMQDVPDAGSQDDSGSEDGSDQDPEEQLGDLDASDPDAVDEKLWGDEKGPEDSAPEQSTSKDHSQQKSENSEVVAKEGNEKSDSKKDEPPQDGKPEETDSEDEQAPDAEPQEAENDLQANGAPMDDCIPDADTLDLPDNMDLDLGEEGNNDMNIDDGELDVPEDDTMESPADDSVEDAGEGKVEEQNEVDNEMAEDAEDTQPGQAEKVDDNNASQDTPKEEGIAPPDIGTGDGASATTGEPQHVDGGESASGDAQVSSGASGEAVDASKQESSMDLDGSRPSDTTQLSNDPSTDKSSGADGTGVQQGQKALQASTETTRDPMRSIGDALKEVRQQFDDILSSGRNDAPQEKSINSEGTQQLEYLRPDDEDQEMQALGPAGEEQSAKLNELKLLDDEMRGDIETPVDVDMLLHGDDNVVEPSYEPQNQTDGGSEERLEGGEGAIMHNPTYNAHSDPDGVDLNAPKADVEMEEHVPDSAVEVELRHWQEAGLPSEGAERMWRLYESLTHDLAYALCEQLRLILEPTLATRLKGDYRTGKRLNMKKIIPYIASDYTKDKIWLRRTRPSQREYQVLIALDDSRSMSESHSVHLAYQTLALVSKALTRLEAGDIGIAKFGESVDILHGFTEGAFSDQTGMKIMSAFTFNQKATNVLSLVDRSLEVLEKAREKRSSASSADLWQLEVIISDGICQDHEQLRSVLRKAEEQRVMIVFIIIDSLDTARGPKQGSILSMEKADFKNVDGRMELQLKRYLDSFPFEYYVVLRDVEALPGVLAVTLKQFFERISEE
ncbi:P-loop containing nucleoside triphosphate hydrolase protein [Guyanagaster necrorhizus]|uniref:Midasin n=1 Tax=Guyanagaster necrorhizus TaxID=856835 RepID=A0A9P8AS39_9AGAR|nr:P-loop containing nucleoside triphosphate hydrolase protein [Guyanagaster necrorhizus MCA 3950]KAG7445730.1 P-loop containing nucleoside triphosphate hydrolase protein [Guyanagaster necrorhizus MCA 3950]